VNEPKPSDWAQERFGDAATDFALAVARAIYQAHGRALAAHVSGGLASNDAYGVTFHVAQYEELAAECGDLPGVSIRKPKDVVSRFDLVVHNDPPVVLYPWRYATDRAVSRERARMDRPVSDLRKSLLSLNANTIPGQLTLDQAGIDPEELEAQLVEEQELLDQLARLGQVVTIGYASNPSAGLFDLGWGDVELVNEETGEVSWHYWEQLPPPAGQAGVATPRKPLAPVDGDGRAQAGRFDDAPLEDDLGLRPRPPIAEPPTSEPERLPGETGSADHSDG
jgi:hypothetical protein